MSEPSETTTLSEFFERAKHDPAALTREDRSRMIAIFRERRGLYLNPKAAKPEKTKVEPGVKLSLADLKLGSFSLNGPKAN